MLIPQKEITELLTEHKVNITGVLHIGAHDCEERAFYLALGLTDADILWIDAVEEKVKQAKLKGIPHIYNAVISERDNQVVKFNIANNIQSSSILELGTHLTEHPWVHYTGSDTRLTTTLDTFFKTQALDSKKCNFWNIDIQGAELLALKGAPESLKNADVLYLEVNEKELYVNCALINQLDDFLATYKFKRVKTVMTKHGWGDAIYVKF